MISATTIADSINTASPNRERITTLKVTFPRFILSELNTHRMFSRNSASSRAIPFKKMGESVKQNPFIPVAWQKFHAGMQGTEYFTDTDDIRELETTHLMARDAAVHVASIQSSSGVSKQICNRYLEPFMWHTALITATEWENFFALRCPQYYYNEDIPLQRSRKDMVKALRAYYPTVDTDPAMADEVAKEDLLWWLSINRGGAEIHISLLAEAMWDALNESTPKELKAGEWHMPYGDQLDEPELRSMANGLLGNPQSWGKKHIPDVVLDYRIKIATARCAQTSYTLMDDQDKPLDYAKLIALHDRLLQSMHMSPFEHCSRAMTKEEWDWYHVCYGGVNRPDGSGSAFRTEHGWCKNFRGWIQYRALIPNENHTAK